VMQRATPLILSGGAAILKAPTDRCPPVYVRASQVARWNWCDRGGRDEANARYFGNVRLRLVVGIIGQRVQGH
jgi:hypothetical protein